MAASTGILAGLVLLDQGQLRCEADVPGAGPSASLGMHPSAEFIPSDVEGLKMHPSTEFILSEAEGLRT